MNNMYDYSTHIDDSDEGEDSSFQCSSISSSSYSSSSSSSRDIYSLETREDSFLENMYQFVKECLSSQELMSRLQPKQKSLKMKKKQVSKQDNQQQQISSKYIKKPSYESKIQKKYSFIDLMIANKYQIILILISIIMIIMRTSDINNIQKEKKMKECLFKYNQNKKLFDYCKERVEFEQQNRKLFSIITIILSDYHQLFYIAIILIASLMLIKNISKKFSIKSFADYENKYKQIHSLNSQQKVKLSDLKNDIQQKQSGLMNNNQQNNMKVSNHSNIFGISFSLNMFFSQKQQNVKSN